MKASKGQAVRGQGDSREVPRFVFFSTYFLAKNAKK